WRTASPPCGAARARRLSRRSAWALSRRRMLAHLLCPAMRDAARRGAAGAHRLEKQSRMIAVNLADDTLARSALAARPRTVIRGNQSTVPAPGPRRHQRRTRAARAG